MLVNGLPDADGDSIPDSLEAPEVAAAIGEGVIHTGLAGSGCAIAPLDRKGPLDPMLALLAIAAAMGARWRRKLRLSRT